MTRRLSILAAAVLLIAGAAVGLWQPPGYERGSGFEATSFSKAFEGGR